MINKKFWRISRRQLAVATATLGLVLGLASTALAHSWQRVTSDAGGFTIQMPGVPEQTTQTVDLNGRATPMCNYLSRSGGETFFVTYSDYPFSAAPGTLLQEVRDGEIGKGRLISDTSITIDGRPGKHVVVAHENYLMVSRIVVDGPRIYQIIYITDDSQMSAAGAAFLNSFHVTR